MDILLFISRSLSICKQICAASQTCFFNSLPDNKILDWSNLKESADEFQIWWKWYKVLQMGRKKLEKREIARYEQFIVFPQVFKILLLQTHKTRAYLGKVLKIFLDYFKIVQFILLQTKIYTADIVFSLSLSLSLSLYLYLSIYLSIF